MAFESEVSPAVEQLLANVFDFTSVSKGHLATMVVLQHLRTPQCRDGQNVALSQNVQKMMAQVPGRDLK